MIMCASLCDYSLRIVLVMLTLGKVSATTTLRIRNDQPHLDCGTMQTVLTCELQSQLIFTMHWRVDGAYVSDCNTTSCDRKDGMPANYNTTVTNVGNIFKLYISPVDIFDNKTFTCTDGDPSNDIRITTEEVKINKSLTTITNKTADNKVVFDVTTNCVFHPGAVKLYLERKKVNGNGGFTSFQVDSTNTTTVCSNTENAYCGGNKTNKSNLHFEIPTDTNGGEMHQFKLHIIQTLENGSYYIISFENDEIGQLKLPVPIPQESLGKVELMLAIVFVFLISAVIVLYLCYKFDKLGLRSWIQRSIPWRNETIQGFERQEVDSSNSEQRPRTYDFRTNELEQGKSLTRRSLRPNKCN